MEVTHDTDTPDTPDTLDTSGSGERHPETRRHLATGTTR